MAVDTDLLDRVLTTLEFRELRSLQWGFVDGALSEDDLKGLVKGCLDDEAAGEDAVEHILKDLMDRCLIFEFPWEDGTYRYRSRFAEGVRLLSRLKQLFPRRPWATAPDLVSDFRVDAAPRAFPRREVPVDDVIAHLSQLPEWTSEHETTLRALIPPHFRLAGFQVRATEAVLRRDPHGRGVVVCAGTGSGKTLAFYYPALTELATLVRKGESWTKAVALYPRVELLKDQLQEVYSQVRRLDGVLGKRGARPLRLGVLFSRTPKTANPEALEQAQWSRKPAGYVCPFLVCPDCGGELVWSHVDLKAGRSRLSCHRPNCSRLVTSDDIALTRQDLQSMPPDILFTTTETLNLRLSDPTMRHVFGVTTSSQRAVRLVLLDEIHTYTGVTGAQTALVLRRWRRLLPADVRFVGLSATLENAPEFLSSLVGISAERVVETSPLTSELDYKTMAYQVVLRGNPASQTQLLSTSIQASFLLARLMDGGIHDGSEGRSRGIIGQRTFVFTDDLDVTNRLFDTLRDAEAYDIFGRPDPLRSPLAALRGSDLPHPQQRMRAGQNWEVIEKIRGPLDRSLRVSRTTSQDAGVQRQSDVIVATASLEVGFDDSHVGAVIQHKAPHDMAAFLQRKGRAGRTRIMRPWMVTILSDFGRDRLAYQEYDRLFDPILKPFSLPTQNRHVLRIQAALTLLDWLADSVATGRYGVWMWRILNGPAQSDKVARAQAQVRDILTRLLDGDSALRSDLERALSTALDIADGDVLQSVLWEPPRSLMLDVIPTLLRRLVTDWKVHPALQSGDGQADLDRVSAVAAVHPLPDFIPANLFSPLNVPDVTIYIPPATKIHQERVESLGIVQALNQLVPGRVTRRFAHERGGLCHWVPVPLASSEYLLPVHKFAPELEPVATFSVVVDHEAQNVTLYRPWAIRLEKVTDKQVSPSSNATLAWQYSVLSPDDSVPLVTDTDARFRHVLKGGCFYLHQFRSPVTLRRYALEAHAKLRLPSGIDRRVRTLFVDDDGIAAVGFEHEVDAFRIELALPTTQDLLKGVAVAPGRSSWLVAFFRHQVLNDPLLVEKASDFQRIWLFQVFFSALAAHAAVAEVDLGEALSRLMRDDPYTTFDQVLDGVFHVDPNAPTDDEDVEPGPGPGERPGVKEALLDLLTCPAVLDRLASLAQHLISPDPVLLGPWLSDRLAVSMAEAALQACQRMAPRHVVPESLLVDYAPIPGDSPNTYEVWITEATTGGIGAMEAIATEAIQTPHMLFSALDAALAPGDHEVVSMGLARFLELVESSPEVASAVVHVRTQVDHAQHEQAFARLRSLLARHGLAVDASLAVALHQRVLRQGTNSESDKLLRDLYRYWDGLEERLGVALDLRTFTYVAVCAPAFAERIRQLFLSNTGEDLAPAVRVAALSGLLWARPHEHRNQVLQSYSPFRRTGWTDPALVRELLLADRVPSVAYETDGWRERLRRALSEDGTVRLRAERRQEDGLQRDLIQLLAEPVIFQDLEFYPSMERLERDGRYTVATLTIKEMV